MSTTRAGGLPELDVARVQRYCAERVPERVRHQVYVECEVAPRRHLTIVERPRREREHGGRAALVQRGGGRTDRRRPGPARGRRGNHRGA